MSLSRTSPISEYPRITFTNNSDGTITKKTLMSEKENREEKFNKEGKLLSNKSEILNGDQGMIISNKYLDEKTGLWTTEIEFINNDNKVTKYQLFQEVLFPNSEHPTNRLMQQTNINETFNQGIITTTIKETKWDIYGKQISNTEEIETEYDTDYLAAMEGDDRGENPEKYI
jgi:hypothetical protein